jgi:uncharacterized protein YdhG (YjbR/CyaY superfamily)
MTKPRPASVDEYIEAAPAAARTALREIRVLLKEVAPDAQEMLKWGMPVFVGKRILFSYAAYKTHLNFMPTAQSLDPFRAELTNYTTGRETIQFPYGAPLPVELIRKIAAHRVWDVRENDARWMY